MEVATTAISVVAGAVVMAGAVVLAAKPELDKIDDSWDCATIEAESVDVAASEVTNTTVEEGSVEVEVVSSADTDTGVVDVVL